MVWCQEMRQIKSSQLPDMLIPPRLLRNMWSETALSINLVASLDPNSTKTHQAVRGP